MALSCYIWRDSSASRCTLAEIVAKLTSQPASSRKIALQIFYGKLAKHTFSSNLRKVTQTLRFFSLYFLYYYSFPVKELSSGWPVKRSLMHPAAAVVSRTLAETRKPPHLPDEVHVVTKLGPHVPFTYIIWPAYPLGESRSSVVETQEVSLMTFMCDA